jgi:hypothetical protein
VRNIVFGEKHDLWSVNGDQEYHEEFREKVQLEPQVVTEAVKDALAKAFPKLDRFAFGVSIGALAGVSLFLATMILVLKGGPVVGPNLQLIHNYFPGYTVTLWGSLLGLGYGFFTGFAAGWVFAFLRNATVFFYMAFMRRRAERQVLRQLLEYF